MSAGSLIRSTYLLYLSQPAADRPLYKAIKGRRIRSVVEIGIPPGERTARLLEVAAWLPENLPLRYTGIDPFELRPQGQPRLALKEAFHRLRFPGVRVQLVPGDPHSALSRCANSLSQTDLLLISANQDQAALERAWLFVPRMLHAESLIFVQDGDPQSGKTSYRQLRLLDVERLAATASRNLRRAA